MSNRYGHESRMDKMLEMDFWLTIGRGTGGSDRPSVRVTAAYPSLAPNERTINLKMKLPLALFVAPQITATIAVGAPDQPVTINADAIAEAVRGVIGADVTIEVQEPEA